MPGQTGAPYAHNQIDPGEDWSERGARKPGRVLLMVEVCITCDVHGVTKRCRTGSNRDAYRRGRLLRPDGDGSDYMSIIRQDARSFWQFSARICRDKSKLDRSSGGLIFD